MDGWCKRDYDGACKTLSNIRIWHSPNTTTLDCCKKKEVKNRRVKGYEGYEVMSEAATQRGPHKVKGPQDNGPYTFITRSVKTRKTSTFPLYFVSPHILSFSLAELTRSLFNSLS